MNDNEHGPGRTARGHRAFPLAFRVEFVRAWLAATERGERARLLRRHDLAWSTVRRWTEAYHNGDYTTAMVEASQRSRSRMDNKDRAELARLREENELLRAKVARGEAVQEILGKAYELLHGINESSTSPATPIPPALMSASDYAAWLERKHMR